MIRVIEWVADGTIYLLITVPEFAHSFYILPNKTQIDYTVSVKINNNIKRIQDSIDVSQYPVNSLEIIGQAEDSKEWTTICSNYNYDPKTTLIVRRL